MRAYLDIAVCCAVLACGSCSLVVDELALRCTQPSDCDALNAEHEIDVNKDCFVYQCRSDGRGCEKRAKDLDGDKALAPACKGKMQADIDCDDNPERGAARTPGKEDACNGVDDDCNGFIDDGAALDWSLADSAPYQIDDPHVVHLSHAQRDDGTLYLALTSLDDESVTNVWIFESDKPARGRLATSEVPPSQSARNCVGVQCKFVELAVGVAPDLVLGLGVNLQGCGPGEMRVGGAGEPWNPRSGSFAWTSEPLVPCTPPQGANRASLSLLVHEPGSSQGLALWRASLDSGDAAPLAGSGLWIDPRGTEPPVLQATGTAELQEIAGSEGLDPAAVVAWPGPMGGYFVAYDVADAVQIAFAPALADRAAAAMSGWTFAEPIAQAGARQVALALDVRATAEDADGAPRGLAAAWRTKGGEVRFATAAFEPGKSPRLGAESLVTLRTGAAILGGPELVYAPTGFSAEPLAHEQSGGGWLVIWIEQDGAQQRLVGTRIAEAKPDEPKGPFTLFRDVRLAHLFAYRSDASTPGYGFIADDGREQLYIGSLACRAQD